MIHTSFSGLPTPPTPATCHQRHQHLQQIIRQQEEEIQQLRDLLLDVLNAPMGRSLCYDASTYEQTLNRLQTQFDRLQQDMVCNQERCATNQKETSCSDTRFGLAATLEQHVTALTVEFSRIKGNCLQFLSGMMSLNWL